MNQDINATLAERGTRYGAFPEHARITQNLKQAMFDSPNWDKLADDQKEALEMVVHKIGRILNGDPNYHDSWHDILGYVKLVEDRLVLPAPSVPVKAAPAPVSIVPLTSVTLEQTVDQMKQAILAEAYEAKNPLSGSKFQPLYEKPGAPCTRCLHYAETDRERHNCAANCYSFVKDSWKNFLAAI